MKYFYRLLLFLIFISIIKPELFSQSKIFDTEFGSASKWDTVNSKSVDPFTDPGDLILATGENENLALKRFARVIYTGTAPTDTAVTNGMRAIDGNVNTFVSIPNNSKNEGTEIRIDLQAMRNVNRVVMYSMGNLSLRPRAFTISVSTDSINYSKVYQELNNIVTPTNTYFEPNVCRYIKITFDVIDKVSFTVITELQVYGVGFLSTGTYMSSVRDAGRPVNWGRFSYNANIPKGTNINFQYRVGNTGSVTSAWSDWSDTSSVNNSLFQVNEPRRYIQYKVNLLTNSLETPRLKDITINYDTLLVAQSTTVELVPHQAAVLRQTELSYNIRAVMTDSSLGIDTLVIETPSPSFVQSVLVNNIPVTYFHTPEQKRMVIAFASRIKASSDISVKFKITPFLDQADFPSRIISKQTPTNPQFMDATKNGTVSSWTLQTTDVPPSLIVEFKIDPNPFSPNGDGKNDKTYLSFFLANLNVAKQLKINIFDISGRLIRTLFNEFTTANAFIEKNSFEWDGKNNDGKLVRPGVYLCQVNIGSDNGGETITKTITVVY
jgi:hypothetical protein